MGQKELKNIIYSLTNSSGSWLNDGDEFKTVLNQNDIQFNEILKYRLNYKLEVWQLAKIFKMSELTIELALKSMGEMSEPLQPNWYEYTAHLGSPYRFNDIFGDVLLKLIGKGMTFKDLAKAIDIPFMTLSDSISGIAFPTIEVLNKIEDVIEYPVWLWRKTSYDLDAYLKGDIKLNTRYINSFIHKSAEEIGPWAEEKKLPIRYLIVLHMFNRHINNVDVMADELGMKYWDFIKILTCTKILPYNIAKALSIKLGIRRWQDLYRVEYLPVNFMYYLKQELKEEEDELDEFQTKTEQIPGAKFLLRGIKSKRPVEQVLKLSQDKEKRVISRRTWWKDTADNR